MVEKFAYQVRLETSFIKLGDPTAYLDVFQTIDTSLSDGCFCLLCWD